MSEKTPSELGESETNLLNRRGFQMCFIRAYLRASTDEQDAARARSQVETFAALKLSINSWRWHGVPIYIRAGKCLPVTVTEAYVQLRQPPAITRIMGHLIQNSRP